MDDVIKCQINAVTFQIIMQETCGILFGIQKFRQNPYPLNIPESNGGDEFFADKKNLSFLDGINGAEPRARFYGLNGGSPVHSSLLNNIYVNVISDA